jgi:hypothetical protein
MDVLVGSTIILGIWAAVGPLVGIRYGQELAKRWQKEHWIAQNRKQEFQEVLEAIASHFDPVNSGFGSRGTLRAPAEMRVREVFRTRIFIIEEMKALKVQERWEQAVGSRDKGCPREEFRARFEKLCDDLRSAAIGAR